MTDRQDSLSRNDTFPKILLHNAESRGDKPAYREKDYGIWQTHTWRETSVNVRALACGLAAWGLKRGDMVSIIGDNRPDLYWAFAAIQAVHGIPVPVYQDSVADEMLYVLEHSEVRVAFAENQEQVDKLLSIMDRLPSLKLIIYSDPRGMRNYEQPFIISYQAMQEKGRAFDAETPDFYLDSVAQGGADDIALIAYTSGTTGNPKGVMLSFANLAVSGRLAVELEGLDESDNILSYLPMAWVGDHFASYGQAYIAGFTVNCPESSDTVMQDLHEIGPSYFFAPPSIFENLLTQVMIRMEDASAWKQHMFRYFLAVAEKCGADILEGRPVSFTDRMLYRLGDLLIYAPLKDNLGLRRIRRVFTGGAPLGVEVFGFYRSLGINLKQIYGQTESSAYVCLQRNNDVKSDTVGPPAPGCEVKIAEDGEVIYKSPGAFIGYYKNEEATAETKDADGWIHTGDAGIIDDGGHLKIIDRAKDVGKLNDGTLFAPQYIENKLKFSPYIKEAVCHGDHRDYVTAFVNIDPDSIGNWAERRGMAYTSYFDLTSRDEVYQLVSEAIAEVNQSLAADSALASSQIKRFLILHKELDADDGELTRTRKVRRRIVAERYEPLISGLFSDADHASIDTTVTYEDGRQNTVSADLRIGEAQTFASRTAPSMEQAA